MKLSTKTTLFFTFMVAGLIVVLVAISLYSFRAFSITSATEHVRTTAEVVRVHLTEAMINGVISKREGFLKRLMEVEGLRSAKVIRSGLVEKQFGKGLVEESQPDDVEHKVLSTGKAEYVLTEDSGDTIFRGTIPFVATARGSPNCLQCHQVNEGAVLGAVTMTLSIDHLKQKALVMVSLILAATVAFGVVTLLLLRRLMGPVAAAAQDVEDAVQKAIEGNFAVTLEQKTSDEIGHISSQMNRLLRFLEEGLNRIGGRVAELTNRTPMPGENLLTATADMVDSLAKAALFKQAIEEDETKTEIYQRLVNTLQDEFGLSEYSIYEVNAGKHQLKTVFVDGHYEGDCRWCDQEILVRNEACRARRTGHVVDSVTASGICNAFRPPEDCLDRQHVCIPIIQSGTVGSVVQLVIKPDEALDVHRRLPYISVFLRETSPVLEAKRLMETLRESNLRDPMTGLNNRRFLEEYIETLTANARRQKIHLGILMLDLDYFKMVNDTHGHDAGDAVLRALAKVLRQSVRASDMVIRYGGEEFLIILQDTQPEHTMRIAENIRISVEKLKVPVGSVTLQKTISIGVADFPGDAETFWQVVKFADIALYRAKEDGRNRVIRFDRNMWTEQPEY